MHFHAVRRAPLAVEAALGHIGKFESSDAKTVRGESFGHGIHERRLGARTGTMGECKGGRRAGRAIEKNIGQG